MPPSRNGQICFCVSAWRWSGSSVASFRSASIPRVASYELLMSIGVSASFAPLVLISASLLDIVFGILTLLRPSRLLWLAQIALICIYSLIIVCTLPEFLAQPFGPITKNIPIIAVLIFLSFHSQTEHKMNHYLMIKCLHIH